MSPLPDLGGEDHPVRIVLYIRKAHSSAESHFMNLFARGRVALLHRQIDVRNTDSFVFDYDLQRVGRNKERNISPVGIADHVHLGLKGRNGCPTNDAVRKSSPH